MGKTAIVTGAAGGIGSAVSMALAGDGYDIMLHYNSSGDKAEALQKEIQSTGAQAETFKADISDFSEAEALVNAAVEKFGRVDCLVNNAGITKDGLLMRMTEEEFDRVIAVNLKGCFNTTRHIAKHMLKNRSGCIVNISSVVGVLGNAGQANYAASKAGIIGLTKSSAREFAQRGVRVNAVAPGYIETDMTGVLDDKVKAALLERIPLKRLGQPEDVADLVVFLCSGRSAYMTGQVIVVDGGMAI